MAEQFLFKCVRRPLGWRVYADHWVFEDATLDGAQRDALEVYPKAVFIIYFPGPKRQRRKRRRSYPEIE